jgi:cytochrome P450
VTSADAARALLDPAVLEQPYAFFARLRREAPVVEVGSSGVFLVATAALVEEALTRTRELSSNLTGLLVTGAGGAPEIFDMRGVGDSTDVLATADAPAHEPQRRIVQPALAAGRVLALEPWLRERARARIARWLCADAGDFVAAVSDPLPSEVVSRLLGLPGADLARVQRWAMQGGAMLAGVVSRAQLAALARDSGEHAAYLARHFAAARRNATLRASAPLLDALLRAVEADAMAERTALGIAVILAGAGGESTAAWLGSAVRVLAERVDLQARLRAEPALVPAYLEEVLRLEAPFRFHYRSVREPLVLGGVALPVGARVALLWASANRDEAAHAHPDALDFARPHPRAHLSFGRGVHFCAGAPLARLEARVVVEELLAATRSFSLDPSAPPRHVPSIFVRRLARLQLRGIRA